MLLTVKNQFLISITIFCAFTVLIFTKYLSWYFSTKSSVLIPTVLRDVSKRDNMDTKHVIHNSVREKIVNFEPQKKLILLWTKHYTRKEYFLHAPNKYSCPIYNCDVTMNRNDVNISNAVIFHWHSVKMDDLPENHPKNQLWVLYNREAPPQTPNEPTNKLGPFINYTATYRSDSDIVTAYGRVRPKSAEERAETIIEDSRALIRNKTLLVAWIVSRCKSWSNREEFVKELNKVIPIDVYGKCGQLSCPDDVDRFIRNLQRIACYRYLGSKYKFYLSFENAICKDYVTEKLFYALQVGLVPVVLGGADYERILPKGSFINALDFSTPAKLGEFLLAVAVNQSLYESYLSWRKDFVVEIDAFGRFWGCELCMILNNMRNNIPEPSVSKDLQTWYFGESQCRRWSMINSKL